MYDFLVYKIEMAFECTVSISTLKNNRSIGNSTNTQFILLDLLFTFSSVARLQFLVHLPRLQFYRCGTRSLKSTRSESVLVQDFDHQQIAFNVHGQQQSQVTNRTVIVN